MAESGGRGFAPVPLVTPEPGPWQSASHPWHLVTSPQAHVLGFPNTFLFFHKAERSREKRHSKSMLGEMLSGAPPGAPPGPDPIQGRMSVFLVIWFIRMGPPRAPGSAALGLHCVRIAEGFCQSLRSKLKARELPPPSPPPPLLL